MPQLRCFLTRRKWIEFCRLSGWNGQLGCHSDHLQQLSPKYRLLAVGLASGASLQQLRPLWHNDRMLASEDYRRNLKDLQRLRRARDRMDREFQLPLNVAALASDIHMSAGHFSRLFREAYGESPYAYLMTRRIERAMALLRNSELTVTEICFTVGFSSLGTFSTRFTELTGLAPSHYRQRADTKTDGLPACVVRRFSRPVRNQEAR